MAGVVDLTSNYQPYQGPQPMDYLLNGVQTWMANKAARDEQAAALVREQAAGRYGEDQAAIYRQAIEQNPRLAGRIPTIGAVEPPEVTLKKEQLKAAQAFLNDPNMDPTLKQQVGHAISTGSNMPEYVFAHASRANVFGQASPEQRAATQFGLSGLDNPANQADNARVMQQEAEATRRALEVAKLQGGTQERVARIQASGRGGSGGRQAMTPRQEWAEKKGFETESKLRELGTAMNTLRSTLDTATPEEKQALVGDIAAVAAQMEGLKQNAVRYQVEAMGGREVGQTLNGSPVFTDPVNGTLAALDAKGRFIPVVAQKDRQGNMVFVAAPGASFMPDYGEDTAQGPIARAGGGTGGIFGATGAVGGLLGEAADYWGPTVKEKGGNFWNTLIDPETYRTPDKQGTAEDLGYQLSPFADKR